MRIRRMPQIKQSGVNVTPLIDVVMCLIIFFMLVAKIGVSTGEDRSIDIPTTVLGKDLRTFTNTLTLNVTAPAGASQPMVTAFVEGSSSQYKVLDETTGQSPLREMLKTFRFGKDKAPGAAGNNPAFADNPDFKVVIRAAQDMEYRFLEPVLMICAEARVKNVNFNTKVKTQ